jgi:hypothetical protein
MKGPDGQLDVYAVKFEYGEPIGYQKLDNAAVVKLNAGGGVPYFSPVSTEAGIYTYNHRTGTMELKYDKSGKPIVKATDSPVTQGNIAGAKAEQKELGEARGQAQINLPSVISNAEVSLGLIDQMVGSEDKKVKPHPGMESAVGFTFRPGARFVHGSKEADFMALLDQVKGGAFLEAYEGLKGGGHITEIEGKQATAAKTRMTHAQSEGDFIKAAREYQAIIRKGVERARAKQSVGSTATPKPGSTLRFDAQGNLIESP